MARGQKYGEEIKERAFALAATCGSLSAVAKELGVPRSTVKGWLERRGEGVDTLEEERRRHKERFVDEAWRAIHLGQKLLLRRLERAEQSEEELDRMLVAFCESADGLSADALRTTRRRFDELKLADVGKLAVLLGTLYDKQALAAKEATARLEVTELRFEDL